ncbi:hypothetical protein SNE40_010355 [Patella caerulea]|uniref:Uncharacterized protein n=1 Tax=Patella caerulea TaxID=87958 RepID=A0AAN8Q000_PATCE
MMIQGNKCQTWTHKEFENLKNEVETMVTMVTEGKGSAGILDPLKLLQLPDLQIHSSSHTSSPNEISEISSIKECLHNLEVEVVKIKDIATQPTQHTEFISKLTQDLRKVTDSVATLAKRISMIEKEQDKIKMIISDLPKDSAIKTQDNTKMINDNTKKIERLEIELSHRFKQLEDSQLELTASVQYISEKDDEENEPQVNITIEPTKEVEQTEQIESKTLITPSETSDPKLDILIIGSSIVRDVIPSRFTQKKIKIVIPEPRNLKSAIDFIKTEKLEVEKVIILTGSNDVANKNVSQSHIENMLNDLIYTAQRTYPNSQIYLSEILPRCYDERYSRRRLIYDAILHRQAERNGIHVINQNCFLENDFKPEGVHLNTKGTGKLVSSIKQQIGEKTPYNQRDDYYNRYTEGFHSQQPRPDFYQMNDRYIYNPPQRNFGHFSQTDNNNNNQLKYLLKKLINELN